MANSTFFLMSMMADLASEEFLIEKLEEKIKEYKEAQLVNKSENELKNIFKDVAPYCMMCLMKIQGSDPFTLMGEMDQIEKARNLLNPEKQ